MPFGLSVMRGVFAVTRISGDVVGTNDALATKCRREDLGITRHGKLRKRFARYPGERVQHVRFALLVYYVIEKGSELRPRGLRCGVGDGLHNALEIKLRGDDFTSPEQRLEQAFLLFQLPFGKGDPQGLRTITDNGEAAHNFSVAVTEWTIFTVENTRASGFNDLVLAAFAAGGLSSEGGVKIAILTDFPEEWKHLEGHATEHLRTRQPGNSLHGGIPDNVPAIRVVPEHAIGNKIKNFQQRWAVKQAGIRRHRSSWTGICHPKGSLGSPKQRIGCSSAVLSCFALS